jgi:hypothetical protein
MPLVDLVLEGVHRRTNLMLMAMDGEPLAAFPLPDGLLILPKIPGNPVPTLEVVISQAVVTFCVHGITGSPAAGYEGNVWATRTTRLPQPRSLPDSGNRMQSRSRRAQTSDLLTRFVRNANVFDGCPASERAAMRATLEANAQTLRILELGSGPVRPQADWSSTLYLVVSGWVSLQWLGLNGRTLELFRCLQGETFGASGGRGLADLGLSAVGVPTRGTRIATMIVCPPEISARLLAHAGLRNILADIDNQRLRRGVAWLPYRQQPLLAIGHFLLSPCCGVAHRYHPTLRHRGDRITVEKTVTLAELERLTGLALNTVRSALGRLRESGHLLFTERNAYGTRVVIDHPEELLDLFA